MEYWTFEDVVLDEDQDYPEGQASVSELIKKQKNLRQKESTRNIRL